MTALMCPTCDRPLDVPMDAETVLRLFIEAMGDDDDAWEGFFEAGAGDVNRLPGVGEVKVVVVDESGKTQDSYGDYSGWVFCVVEVMGRLIRQDAAVSSYGYAEAKGDPFLVARREETVVVYHYEKEQS